MQNWLYGQKNSNPTINTLSLSSKRTFDIGLSIVLSIVALPIVFIIAIILYIVYKKNPFYTQIRGVSLSSANFTIIKFRTMYNEVPQDGDPRDFILKKNNQLITPFCAWLRKTGLDELPQLLNVLKGDMSIIGPRPLSLIDLKTLQEFYPNEYSIRSGLQVKPGVSGYWQIFGDRKLGVGNLVEMDAEYVGKMSFAFDCYLVWKTIPVMIMAEHTDAVLGGKELTKIDSAADVADLCTVKLSTEL